MSATFRWIGWSSSWLVLERNTEDSLSKESLPSGSRRCGDMFGGEHAAAHRIVHALDARHVHKTRRAADQRAARETQPRHRLIAALGDGARAIGKPLAAFEHGANGGMRLEALEFVEWRQIRIVVVEMHDEADRHLVVVVMVEERAATGRIVER